MIRHIWSIMCQNIITDQESGSVSYLLGIESVLVPSLPARVPNLAIGTSWSKDSGETVIESFSLRLTHKVQGKADKHLLVAESVSFQTQRHRMNFILNGYQLDSSGIHHFVVEYKQGSGWIDVATIPLLVLVAPATGAATAITPA